MFKLFEKTVKETAESAVMEAAQNILKNHLPQAVDRVLANAIAESGERQFFGRSIKNSADLSHNHLPFVMLMAKRFHHFHKVDALKSLKLARAELRDFLKQEKIKYGDKEYCWDSDAAFELADQAMRAD